MARHTAQQYGLPLLTEVARLLLAERELTINALRADIQAVNAYQRGVLEKQLSEEARFESFVADRSFDNLAYVCEYASILSDLLKKQELNEYVNSLRKSDSLIFFIRPCKELMVNDGIREEVKWDDVVRIDGHVKFMLEMWKLRYFQINTPCMQERVRMVEATMSLFASNVQRQDVSK